MTRPDIYDIKTGDELKRWYWLKEELVNYCKQKHINYTGAKFDILDRIEKVLNNELNINESTIKKTKPTSKFIWSRDPLSLDTIITDSYVNSKNVRNFFKKQCGENFHFSIPFMEFMKANCGKTLQDAVNEWQRLNEQSKNKNFKSEIPQGNQYNKYIRDFFIDNPKMTIIQARHFWKLKKSLPLGLHIYEKEDLKLK